MQKTFLSVWFAGLFLMLVAGPAQAKIELTGGAVVGLQDVDFDSTAGNLDEDFNFNDPRVNLLIKGDVSENVSVTAALWMSNDWSHENMRGNNGAALLDDAVELRATFITLKNALGSGLTLKAGKIVIPYGHEAPNRTSNGDFSKNDFISNSLLDISGIDDGVTLSGSFEGMSLQTPVAWEAAAFNGSAVTDGNPSGGGAQTRSNDDLGFAGRISAGVMDNLTMQFSFYMNDQIKDGKNDVLHIGSTFFVNAVQDAIGSNKNLAGLVYNDPDNGGGYDRELWEVSAKYDLEGGHLMGFWGNIDADTSTAGNSREWNYWGVSGRYDFDENSYLAGRWNALEPDYAGAGALGEPTLLTVAAGYKLADNAWVKAEWSSFDEDGAGFSNEGTVVGAVSSNDAKNADADALTLAVGVKF